MNVLYIEDDFVDQIAFKRLAKKFDGLNFQVAASLGEAVKLIPTNDFDLVLSDYFLAGDTVMDVIDQIKDIPIFLVSGLEDTNHIKTLYKNGIRGHFLKPLTEEDISSILNKNCNRIYEKKSTPAANKSIKPDLSGLEKLSQNSSKLKIELMEIFLTVAEKEKESVKRNLNEKKWKDIGLSVHKLKSNLRMMGYQPLLEKANEIETNCLYLTNLDGMFREIPAFLIDLEKGMKIIESKLSTLKKSPL